MGWSSSGLPSSVSKEHWLVPVRSDHPIEGDSASVLHAEALGGVNAELDASPGGSIPARFSPEPAEPVDAATQSQVKAALATLPLYFIENRGQVDSRVAYYVQGSDTSVYFTARGVTFALTGLSGLSGPARSETRDASIEAVTPRARERWAVKLDFLGASDNVRLSGQGRTSAVVSYFKGEQAEWKTGLPTYSGLAYQDLWPGIDLIYTGTESHLKYTFVVQPGADPNQIELEYVGATDVRVTDEGRLAVSTPVGGFEDDAPYVYQEVGREQVTIDSAYVLHRDTARDTYRYGFYVGAYDKSQPLILDPVVLLTYSGYIGGSGTDFAHGIAVDDSGNAYVAGQTTSSAASFPVTPGSLDEIQNGGTDAFVAKVNASGTALIYCGYIGGTGNDAGQGIAVDGSGNAYVTGPTSTSDGSFPVMVGPDLTYNGTRDAFVAKVNASGTALVYSGYIGGSGDEFGRGIAVDGSGNAYVTGNTGTSDGSFPVGGGFPYTTYNGGTNDAFVAKVNAGGTALVYSGYIGGSGDDLGRGIVVDGSGNAYVTGETSTSDGSFPVAGGFPDTTYNGGTFDAFVAKVNAGGTALVYSGFIGGTGVDRGSSIAVDSAGNAYVTGNTGSTEASFPVVVGPDLTYNGGTWDAFVTKVNASGTALSYSGYIGGSATDLGQGIAVDSSWNAYVMGDTTSTEASFPVAIGPDLTFNDTINADAFVAKVNPSGRDLNYCGYVGGSSSELAAGIALDNVGNAYVVGSTLSSETSFPVEVGPDSTYNGGFDAFVAKVVVDAPLFCTVTTDIGSGTTDWGHAVAVQSDGKIVVAGYTNSGADDDFALVRYNPDGGLDSTFGTGGKVITDIGSGTNDRGHAVAIQIDGKIVVAGYSNGGDSDFAVARYNPDGSLDTSFDTDGKQTTDIEGIGGADVGDAVALQSDGKIVVAGRGFNGADDDFAVVRYNANGSLDTSFDTDGKVTTDFGFGNDLGQAVAIQSDDKIVVAGFAFDGTDFDFAVVRYDPTDGSLDSSFDTDGIVTTDFGSGDRGHAVAIQGNGKIVVAGSSAGGLDFAVARYNPDGSLDSSFDTDGKQITDISSTDSGRAVAIQSDSKIVVAGYAFNGTNDDLAVVRYNADGSLDSTFGTGGIVVTDLGSGELPLAMAIRYGKIVVAGQFFNGSDADFGVVSYRSDGSLECPDALHPVADAGPNDFTPNGCVAGSHYDCVNDQTVPILNAGTGPVAANDAATYLEGTSGREMFDLDDGGTIPANALITRIEVFAQVGKQGPNASASLSYQRVGFDATPADSPATSVSGTCCGLLISYAWPGLSWSKTELDALTIGIVHQSNTLRVSQIYVLVDYEIPTEVELVSFTASGFDGEVLLEWETASELNNLGFQLYRATSDEGPYGRITAQVIPGLGSSPVGARYRYRDMSLTNGVTYFYKLEDIETTGKTTMHGPVSAAPYAGATSPTGEEDERLSSLITYGDPEANSFRVIKRKRRSAIIELLTEGFYAEPQDDGTVLLRIPGFEPTTEPDAPSVPVKRPWVEALAGRNVKITSVRASSIEAIDGLRLAGAQTAELVATQQGTVRVGRRLRRAFLRTPGLFPAEISRVLSTGYQGEAKKVQLELAPLRWDGASGRLLLARRLLVHLSFRGRDREEVVRGRRHRARLSHKTRGVVARFVTTDKGLYEVRYEDVFRRSRGVKDDKLRLSRHGEPVAFHIEPDRTRFGPGSKLYFLSDGAAANPYGYEAVYELELNEEGTRMHIASAPPSGQPTAYYFNQDTQEENRIYQAGLLDAPDLWLWDVLVAPSTKSFPFQVQRLASSTEPALLTVWLQGVSDFPVNPDHHLRLYLNENFLEELSWDGKLPRRIDMELLPGNLLEGDNTLEIENVGDTGARYSMVMLDRFAVEYPRQPVAENGSLEGRWSESGTAAVSGLHGRAHLLDVTDITPRWLTGAEVSADGTLLFRTEAGRRYLATSAAMHPEVRQSRDAGLKKKTQRADYVVIGPAEFLDTIKPLLRHRRQQGLKSKFVALEDIYEAFGFGEMRPEAIKEFIEYAYHHWREPTLKYVLLLGDATFDFKDYLQTGVPNKLPPLMIKTSYLWTVSDPALAAVNGDDILPDVAIGRLPAATTDELRAIVDKILAYETGTANLESALVLVTDNSDLAGDFLGDSQDIANGVLAGRDVRQLSLTELGGGIRAEILSAFDEGASLISYIGHGGIHLWADENIFNIRDVPNLKQQSQQPLFLTMNCLNGYFHFPFFNSLAEELLKAKGKGAIAAFSPSGLSLNNPAHRFHQAVLDAVFNQRHERLGDAILAAQASYAETGAFPELLSIYHLLGDPGGCPGEC